MTDDLPMYAFDMLYTDWSDDPYYHRDWYGAKSVEVVATTKQEAAEAARAMLGAPPCGRVWGFHIKSVRDIRIPAPDKETR